MSRFKLRRLPAPSRPADPVRGRAVAIRSANSCANRSTRTSNGCEDRLAIADAYSLSRFQRKRDQCPLFPPRPSSGTFLPGELSARTSGGTSARQGSRPSLAEHYPAHGDYVAKVTAAANDLVSKRLLLPEDAASIIAAANAAAVP